MIPHDLPDVEKVAAIIEETSQAVVMPRFTRLSESEIERKHTPGDADDIVTIVDREVEERLSAALSGVYPSAEIIGEEDAYARPGLLDLLASDGPLWIVDPIDGTKNFAAGHDGFAIMVAFVLAGHARAAWMTMPARRQTFVAVAGAGAFLNGDRIEIPPAQGQPPRGAIYVRYMPDETARRIDASMEGRVDRQRPSGCSAVEYADILTGQRDFAVYYKLLPWDHAGPALILSEAGGVALHWDGTPYTARSKDQVTVLAGSDDLGQLICGWLSA